MPRLLPVETGNYDEIDIGETPRNPQEYLRQVQREASLCPDVVVAKIDPKKIKKPTVNLSFTACQAAPEGFSPSLKWQEKQVSNFSEIRQSIHKNRQQWRGKVLDDNVVLPKTDDEEGWRGFCLGVTVYRGLTADTGESASPGVEYDKVGFPPLLSIVSRLNQATVNAVLEYLISWFEEKPFVPQLGRWLYSLLACLEKPLTPEAHSLIRQLAKRCASMRATLETKDDERLSPLNLLICLVARYFEQNDLADRD